MRVLGVGVCVLIAALAGGAAVPAQAQDAAAKAATLLADARKAVGGEDKIGAVKRLQASGTVRRGAGNVNLEGDLELFIELPDKFRRNETLTIGANGQEIERIEVVNGAETWEETRRGGGIVNFGGDGDGGGDFGGGGGGGRGDRAERDGDAGAGRGQIPPERLEAQNQARLTESARVLLAVLLTPGTPMRWIGTAKSPDGEADVLEMKTPDGTATRLLLDAKTHLPLMLTWTGVPQDAFAAMVGRAGFGGGRGGRGGRGGFQGGRGGQGRGDAPQGGGQVEGRRGRGAGSLEPTTLQMFLSEYKAVNGIQLPHLMTRGANGEITEEWIVKNYRINSNFKADTFSK